MIFDTAPRGVSLKRTSSELENRFASLWDALGGPELMREYRFDKSRRWRADFAWLDARVLVEIEGGVWNKGRHVTPRGFLNDAEKYLAATLQGWAVIRLVDCMLTPDMVKKVLDYARKRISGKPVV